MLISRWEPLIICLCVWTLRRKRAIVHLWPQPKLSANQPPSSTEWISRTHQRGAGRKREQQKSHLFWHKLTENDGREQWAATRCQSGKQSTTRYTADQHEQRQQQSTAAKQSEFVIRNTRSTVPCSVLSNRFGLLANGSWVSVNDKLNSNWERL